jgi:CheY-like chemotaxis protein
LEEESLMPRILVVEDSLTQAESLRLVLEAEGFEVLVAWDGQSALEALANAKFDLVLSDVLMPGMSGYDLCRQIKSDPNLRSTPFVVLTQLNDPLDVLQGLESGADNFLIKPIDAPYLLNRIRTVLANAGAEPTPSGTPLAFRGKGVTITADKAQILDLLLAALEESIRARERERQALAAREALVEDTRRKDEYLAMLAHELRGPLAPLLTTLHVLGQADVESGVRDQCLARLTRQIGHLKRLTDDLLETSRVNQGKVRLRPERLDLARLVRTAAEDWRATLEQAGLTLVVHTPQTPVRHIGDSTRLSQVLANLLDNTVRYTERGGQVTVRVGIDAARGEAMITVTDTGVGIAPTVRSRLFRPFVQAEQGPDRARGGLGLGLAVVKGLVELHRGTVEAFSDGIGRGATFTVRLPLEREPPALLTAPLPRPEGSAPAVRRRVLVIEDQRDAAESLSMLLRLLGHEVRCASDGPEGVQAATDWPPDVIVSDIGLPGFDGFEVARRIRRLPTLAGVLLIALTGYGSEEDRHNGRSAGFDHYLVKPANPDDLRRLLATSER